MHFSRLGSATSDRGSAEWLPMFDPPSPVEPGVQISSTLAALVNDQHLQLDADLPPISHIRDDHSRGCKSRSSSWKRNVSPVTRWVEMNSGVRDLRAGVNIMRGPEDITPLHFDRTYLNIMIPLVVPSIKGDRRGQLIISPNIRSFDTRRVDRCLIPAICHFRPGRALFTAREVDSRPGYLYCFYAYRSLHGVMPPSEAGPSMRRQRSRRHRMSFSNVPRTRFSRPRPPTVFPGGSRGRLNCFSKCARFKGLSRTASAMTNP